MRTKIRFTSINVSQRRLLYYGHPAFVFQAALGFAATPTVHQQHSVFILHVLEIGNASGKSVEIFKMQQGAK